MNPEFISRFRAGDLIVSCKGTHVYRTNVPGSPQEYIMSLYVDRGKQLLVLATSITEFGLCEYVCFDCVGLVLVPYISSTNWTIESTLHEKP